MLLSGYFRGAFRVTTPFLQRRFGLCQHSARTSKQLRLSSRPNKMSIDEDDIFGDPLAPVPAALVDGAAASLNASADASASFPAERAPFEMQGNAARLRLGDCPAPLPTFMRFPEP